MVRSTQKLQLAAAVLATVTAVHAQISSEPGPEWNHEDYSTSPPVYPTPNTTGLGGWEAALEKAKSWVAQLTTDEKAIMVTGTEGPCVG